MATYTSNYGWTKPSGSDNVDISVLNNNLDDQDSTIHDAFLNMAPPFSESSTYAVDDIVLYGTGLYKCHTAVVTPGSWTGSTNWQVYKLSEGGSGGGGTTNYNALTNKPQINSVELSGNKTSAQLGLMASDGVVANPTGQTTGTLTALEVGGTKYAVGGGSGTSDYTDLTNKPSINGVTLSGNKTTRDLGITASGVGAIPSTDKGANGGVAELDSNGKVPSSQLPSYVDDVLSYSSQSAFPATGETGKIYIAEDTNKTYRWSGSAYAEISASLALGETSSTAYRGDRGKTAYDHSQTTGNPHGTTASDVGLGNVPNVSTNDQTPTFTEASTRNNIASGEKLSVILGKTQKFFNDLKTVAFSGSYTDLSDKPTIPTTAGGISYDNINSGLSATNVQGAVDELALSQMNPLSHNGIYTGRNLGTINSASDWAAFRAKYGIADKTYKGLYLGDYVKVNDGTYNADWMVAGFNTETNKGNTNICPECVSMIPRVGDGCGTSYMNSTNVTTGGYKNSYMHTTKLPDVAAKLTTIFGSNLVTRDILASNTVTNGYASNWEWVSCKCSLLTSVQVYGSLSFENTGGTYCAGYNIGEGCEKLPVFNFINPVQFRRSDFWLRGVNSASHFCVVAGYGSAVSYSASAACGVRPLICLN